MSDRTSKVLRPLFADSLHTPYIQARGFTVELSDGNLADASKVSYVHIIPPDENSPGCITFTIPDQGKFEIARKECETHADMLNKRKGLTVNEQEHTITLAGVDPVNASMITKGLEQRGALSEGTADRFHETLMTALHDWQQAYGNPEVTRHVKTETSRLQDYYRHESQQQLPMPPTVHTPPAPSVETPLAPLRAAQADNKMTPTSVKMFVKTGDSEAKIPPTVNMKNYFHQMEEDYNKSSKSPQQAAGNPQVKKLMKFAADQANKGVKEINEVAQDINVAALQKAQAIVMSAEKLASLQSNTISHS